MLLELTVENLAVIEFARLEFGPGFTALTGETGAGKSLLVDSMDLALGGRAESDLVRHGCARAVVTLSATIDTPELAACCEANGVHVADGELVVCREVSAEGRSTVRLNGRATTVGVLREIGHLLVDMHGQHDHQALLSAERQLDFLDRWAGAEVLGLREQVSAVHGRWVSARTAMLRAHAGRREREQRTDMLEFQVADIEAAAPQVGEAECVSAQILRLKNLERLKAAAEGALERVYDSESAALDTLRSAQREIELAGSLDPNLARLGEEVRTATESLVEVGRSLREYVRTLDAEPGALESTAERAETLARLRRKYGDTEEVVLQYLDAAKDELQALRSADVGAGELEARVAAAKGELDELAARLTQARGEAAVRFGAETQAEVRELAMEKAVFAVELTTADLGSSGADAVEFVFSANVGDPPRPLAKVASGGEMSRVMLGIKVASAGRAGVPSMVFDEVDSGMSGKTAAVVGKKLASLARSRQVLVISHLPQVAARADQHYSIVKVEQGGRVSTQVTMLDGPERENEVARMLAGESVGESALLNARELLAPR